MPRRFAFRPAVLGSVNSVTVFLPPQHRSNSSHYQPYRYTMHQRGGDYTILAELPLDKLHENWYCS
ncbi:hypothetical protein BU25DRAFT_414647 [Macroventuria anomochaeta]|uniref:Uncharacterized protein n=1 Tax=Macroventuria anomochaeta TaxID=301207 RepID=A0ACB6RQC0_9PLEO|nr:uncharacterized protein BU25DRAFT_414647 [Macroventuria anomochaeta]KAF2623137.1 hypothetical protein BU25DRAFT_414647 [Macroventuria anomochaeta]